MLSKMADETVITLDSRKTSETIQVIENQLSIMKSCYDSIMHDASALRGTHWDAASADSFIDTISGMCSEEQLPGRATAGTVLSILRAYVLDLNMVIEKSGQTENKITRMVEALPTNAFNV